MGSIAVGQPVNQPVISNQVVVDTLIFDDTPDVSLLTIDYTSKQETYKLCPIGVIRQSDSVEIPNDPANQDWIDYQIWLANGFTPIPADPIPQPTLQDRRWVLYPTIQDQLDALYQARQGNPAPLAAIDAQITATNQLIAS